MGAMYAMEVTNLHISPPPEFDMLYGLKLTQMLNFLGGVLQEPTSGLDARAAAIVMRAVRNIVNTGRTIVCTIHQPSIDIFEVMSSIRASPPSYERPSTRRLLLCWPPKGL